MRPTTKITAGIRTSHFSNAVLFLTTALNLEIVHHDQEKEIAQLKLPSGQILEIFGSKNLWRSFTTPPDWEWIVADIRYKGV